jgi:hypothetical protein
MSLINSTLQSTVVRLRDITGNVTVQKIHSRIFDAYEAKSLVLEALNPEQQQVLAAFNGIIPPLHPVGQPAVLDKWEDLMALHNDSMLYQLLPRRARTNAAYSVMRAVSSSTGSPFRMEDRYDPLETKFVFRAADQEAKQAFNNKSSEKVGSSIWLDGILRNAKHTGLVMAHPAASPAHVNQLVGTVQFLKEWSSVPDGDRHRDLRTKWKELLSNQTHLFIGSSALPAKDLVAFARGKGVHLYAKRNNEYIFVP